MKRGRGERSDSDRPHPPRLYLKSSSARRGGKRKKRFNTRLEFRDRSGRGRIRQKAFYHQCGERTPPGHQLDKDNTRSSTLKEGKKNNKT